jgi:TonB family protein
MAETLLFLINASASMILLYIAYLIFFSRQKHFVFNRFFLLGSYLVACLIPFVIFPVQWVMPERGLTAVLEEVIITGDGMQVKQEAAGIVQMLWILYLSGVVVFAIRLVVRLIRLWMVRRSGSLSLQHGCRIVIINGTSAPFSFFRTVYLDQDTLDDNHLQIILRHEAVHIQQFHTLDVIISELFTVLFWFNPVVWKAGRSLREIHEYIADHEIVRNQEGIYDYYHLLYRRAIDTHAMLANYFNQTLTLKRILMMKKNGKGSISFLKLAALLPLIALMTIFLGKQIHSVGASTFGPKELIDHTTLPEPMGQNRQSVLELSDPVPVFPGGQEALVAYLVKNIVYPQKAKEKGIQGVVLVSFTVTKTGKVADVKVKRGVDDLLDAEALRVIKGMPDWKPGEKDGQPVDVAMVLPVSFKLAEK